tara:strand:- start:368 stop:982 length:615 start_codon:yes stop_codon:yes gene_type:complete
LSNKIRIRSEEELEDRRKCFLEISEALDELKISYFLIGGVLLGAKRDKKFIEWDWDVEINLLMNDLNNNFEKILSKLLEKNFKIEDCRKTSEDSKINFYKNYNKDVTGYTISGWNHDKLNGRIFRNRSGFPDHFIKEFEMIEFYEKKFKAPSPIDEYLSYQFGDDWKIRKRTDNKTSYMTSKFFKRESLFYKIIVSLINKLKKI